MRNLTRACAIFYIISLISINRYIEGALGSFIHIFGVITFWPWILSLLERKRLQKFTPTHVFVLLFFAMHVLSFFWTRYTEVTVEASYRMLLMLGTLIVVYDLFAEDERSAAVCSQAGVLGCTGIALWTMLNWHLGKTSAGDGRFGADGIHPNSSAFLVMVGVPLAWDLVSRRMTPWAPLRYLNAVYPFLAVMALFLTGSRGGMLEAIPIFIWAIYMLSRTKGGVPVLVGMFLLASTLVATNAEFQENFSRVTDFNRLEKDKGSGRGNLWPLAYHMFQEQPLTGVGAGAFPMEAGSKTTEGGKVLATHNAWLESATEMGVPGFTSLFLVIFSLGALTLKAPKGRRGTLFVAWVPFPIMMIYEHVERMQFFWAILIVVFVQASVAARTHQEMRHRAALDAHRKRMEEAEPGRVPQFA